MTKLLKNMDPHPTKHLLKQMDSRAVSWGEIVDVIDNPEVIFGPDERGRYTVQSGNLCVVMADNGAVITVLLRQKRQWCDQDMVRRDE